jgi:ribosomal protein S18 acetylase RimI-like enzyme
MSTPVGELAGDKLEVRFLDEPRSYAPLIDFCCGKGKMPEHEVNRTVRFLYADMTKMDQTPAVLENVSARDVNGHPPLLAVCSFSVKHPLPAQGVDPAWPHGYIVAVGTDLDAQGKKLDDRKSVGSALLRGAFEELKKRLDQESMPYVWATIKTNNDKSARLLDRHGFDPVGFTGEIALAREPDCDPDFTRDLSWSLSI